MLLPLDIVPRDLNECHDGTGVVHCKERLAEYDRHEGIKFVHDNIIPPGASIGFHQHVHDEELYMILNGTGEMRIDDETVPVGPGDICLTRPGHSHALVNTGKTDMHFYVIGCQLAK
ncbi:MAG TPA: cupin domain-containing protein [Capsulimonadaceae bacterium]|jgi:uncharacterized cupin superfamily protein